MSPGFWHGCQNSGDIVPLFRQKIAKMAIFCRFWHQKLSFGMRISLKMAILVIFGEILAKKEKYRPDFDTRFFSINWKKSRIFFNFCAFFILFFFVFLFWKNVSKSGRYFSFFKNFFSKIFEKGKFGKFRGKVDFDWESWLGRGCPFWYFLGPFWRQK